MLGQLHDVDLQLLRLFVRVVECGGFSAAQGELGLSQSSISQQMAKLETRLGYRLCSRGKGGFSVTPKGEQLLIAIRTLFQSIETFRHQSNGVAGRLIGEVRMGLSEAVDQSVLLRVAEAIRRFRERDESVRIELISAMPGEMERLLLQQRLDLALGYFSQVQSAFDYRELFRETQHLYCAQGIHCSASMSRMMRHCRPATGWIIHIGSCARASRFRISVFPRVRNRSRAPSPSFSPASMSTICRITMRGCGRTKACCVLCDPVS